MQPSLSTSQWLQLPQETRETLRRIFNIRRSVGTEVRDNTVLSDGSTFQDLQVMSVDAMQKFLDSKETDFFILFDKVVALATSLSVKEGESIKYVESNTHTITSTDSAPVLDVSVAPQTPSTDEVVTPENVKPLRVIDLNPKKLVDKVTKKQRDAKTQKTD